MDTIFLQSLEVSCIVGAHAAERRGFQELLIDLDLEADCAKAGSSDDLADTVDYEALALQVRDVVEKGSFHLVEAVAEAVAGAVLASCPGARAVKVRVTKTGVVAGTAAVGVEIHRVRKGCRQ